MKKMNFNDTMMAVSTIMSIILVVTSIMLMLWIRTSYDKNNYDVNNDGQVNSKDMLDLRKYLIEKGE